MKRIELIVTRHPALVQYLFEIGMAKKNAMLIKHASAELVRGKHVAGVLPHSLSCECASFTEIPLRVPLEIRGNELSIEEIRQYAGEPVAYSVTRI